MKKYLLSSIVATFALLLMVTGVAAANGYSLFGDAAYVSPGNASSRAVELSSDYVNGLGYSGVDYEVPAGTTFADLTELSTDYYIESDDTCLGGSPRFQVNVVEGGVEKNIFVYLETEPGNVCTVGAWTNSGDELDAAESVDTSQLTGGTFYDPYLTALTKYGALEVTGVQLVVDSGWAFADQEQTALVDNTNIDGVVYDYEPNTPSTKDDCKKGGWQDLENADGEPFKNQGQCVSYFNHQ